MKNSSASSPWRYLLVLLLASLVLNLVVLGALSYWGFRERPPTPYCALKPVEGAAADSTHKISGAKEQVLAEYASFSFQGLVQELKKQELVEDGFRRRDFALALLQAIYELDVDRAIRKEQRQDPRIFIWRQGTIERRLLFYSGLHDAEFASISRFAQEEAWPISPKAQFTRLQEQKRQMNIDPTLAETFMISPDFWTFYLLFHRTASSVSKEQVLELLLEGSWDTIDVFVREQKQAHDLSLERKRRLLLLFMKTGSSAAARLLLQTDFMYAVKQLDDAQVIEILRLLSGKTQESEAFAKEMLKSPRSQGVWQQASLRLYEYAGEPIPKSWSRDGSLERFLGEQKKKKSLPLPLPKKSMKTPVVPAPVVPAKSHSAACHQPTRSVSQKKNTSPCRIYIVQQGDSLWKISRRFGVGMQELMTTNQLSSAHLKPGTLLKIPSHE